MTKKKDASPLILTVGDTVGLWTVIGEMTKKQKKNFYPCRCACGTEMSVPATALTNETALSCGCEKAGVGAIQAEQLKVRPHLQSLFDLISQGRLPPADGMSVQGQEPNWNLESIAKLIGISEEQLIEHLKDTPARFTVDMALP